MARKTKVFTLPGVRDPETPGMRDNGKSFLLTEMPALQAEKWANRVFLAIAHSGLDIPQEISTRGGGMAELQQLAMLVGHLRFPDLESLMDELLGCIRFVGDPHRPEINRALIIDGVNDDIEDFPTFHILRTEVLNLHVNFSLAANILTLIAVASTITDFSPEITETSRQPSRQSSRRTSRRSKS